MARAAARRRRGGEHSRWVIGSVIGGWLLAYFHLVHGNGFLGDLIGAAVGAILLLFALRLVRRTA